MIFVDVDDNILKLIFGGNYVYELQNLCYFLRHKDL
jgi:hypothetical protein